MVKSDIPTYCELARSYAIESEMREYEVIIRVMGIGLGVLLCVCILLLFYIVENRNRGT